jgi:hypothetical protein
MPTLSGEEEILQYEANSFGLLLSAFKANFSKICVGLHYGRFFQQTHLVTLAESSMTFTASSNCSLVERFDREEFHSKYLHLLFT